MRNCRVCGNEIHPKRLEILPNTFTCVPCSDTQKKGVINVMKGTGDHTWVETVFLEAEDYKKYMEIEDKVRKIITPKKTKNDDFDADSVGDIPKEFTRNKKDEEID